VLARPVTVTPLTSARPLPAGDPMRLARLSRGRAALDLFLALLVGLALPLTFDLALAVARPAQALDDFTQGLAAQKWAEAPLIGGLAVLLLARHRLAPAAFGLSPARIDRQLLWSVPTLAIVNFAFALSMVIVLLWIKLHPGWEADLERRTEFMQLLPVDSVLATIALMVPVALHEELLFRGLLIPYLRRITGHWAWAVLLSAGIFAVLHIAQGVLGVVQMFALGVAFGICFIATRSVLTVALAHFAFNVLQVQLARFALPYARQVQEATGS
jgi:membrane protease YdiL (CAAX protease family)